VKRRLTPLASLVLAGVSVLAALSTLCDITYCVIAMNDPALLVLASLADGDKHGYAIMEDIRMFADVRLGPGTLYGTITRLEQQRLIRPVKTSGRRQPYSITIHGRRLLQQQAEVLRQVSNTALRRLKQA
jgi:DNA-binding PadR family transcriptional regulator